MRVHLIRDGVVENSIVAESIDAVVALFPDATVIEATEGGPGWTWDGATLTAPPPPQMTGAEVTEARRLAYVTESDSLFMAWQAAVATGAADQNTRKAAWLAARAAVQARLPYPG